MHETTKGAAGNLQHKRPTIGVMGTPVTSGNRGVLALGASVVDLCGQAMGGADVVLLLASRDAQPVRWRVAGVERLIRVVNYRMSFSCRAHEHLLWILGMALLYRVLPFKSARARIVRSCPWIKALVECDLVGDIRGGDSFSDIYGMKRFLLGCIPSWIVVLVKGHCVMFPQTYGPYAHRLARVVAKLLIRSASVVMARDKTSLQIAEDLRGRGRSATLCPDVAFSLESVVPDTIELYPALAAPVAGGTIGININGLLFNGGYTRDNMFKLKLEYPKLLPALIEALLEEHRGDLWLVPHTFAPNGSVESDPEASRTVWEQLPDRIRSRVRIVNREYDQYEIKGVIGQCEFFIGSRMHACIAALSQGIPCVGIAYSMKFAGVFESVGMADWVVDGRTATISETVDRILAQYRCRNEVREPLRRRVNSARQQLTDAFRELVASCDSGDVNRKEQ